jgi:hypothetical protein
VTTTDIPATAIQVGNFVVLGERAQEVVGVDTTPVLGLAAITLILRDLDTPVVLDPEAIVAVKAEDHEF